MAANFPDNNSWRIHPRRRNGNYLKLINTLTELEDKVENPLSTKYRQEIKDSISEVRKALETSVIEQDYDKRLGKWTKELQDALKEIRGISFEEAHALSMLAKLQFITKELQISSTPNKGKILLGQFEKLIGKLFKK